MFETIPGITNGMLIATSSSGQQEYLATPFDHALCDDVFDGTVKTLPILNRIEYTDSHFNAM